MKKTILFVLLLCAGQLFAQTEKCVKGNCKTGTGRREYADGSYYEGGFVNGYKEGKGVFESKEVSYTGEWKQGDYDGEGTLIQKKLVNGVAEIVATYTGTFKDGKLNGPGKHIEYLQYATGPDTNFVWTGNFKDNILNGKGSFRVKPFCTLYSDNWTDNYNFSRGKEIREKTNETSEGSFINAFFDRDKKLNETEKRMADIKAGKVTHGAPIKHAERVTNFSEGRYSEIITWGMMGSFYSGFKRYFISPTLYSKKYPIPFGARFTYQLVNSKKEVISEQVKYGNDLECYFDVPTDGDYTIQAAYDFDGCTGCNDVSAIRVMFGLYSLDFTNK